jgi:hypothetical protein
MICEMIKNDLKLAKQNAFLKNNGF